MLLKYRHIGVSPLSASCVNFVKPVKISSPIHKMEHERARVCVSKWLQVTSINWNLFTSWYKWRRSTWLLAMWLYLSLLWISLREAICLLKKYFLNCLCCAWHWGRSVEHHSTDVVSFICSFPVNLSQFSVANNSIPQTRWAIKERALFSSQLWSFQGWYVMMVIFLVRSQTAEAVCDKSLGAHMCLCVCVFFLPLLSKPPGINCRAPGINCRAPL